MLVKNDAQYHLRLMYDELESSGLGKLVEKKSDAPEGMKVLDNPVTLRSIVVKNPDGTTTVTGVNRWLAIDPKVAPEIKQALQLNTNWKNYVKENVPILNDLSQIVIKTQVSLGIDLGFHTFNDMLATVNSPPGLLGMVGKVKGVLKARTDLVNNNQVVLDEISKMAEQGVSFRGESLGGWSSHALRVADTVTRLVLNREYDELVGEKKVVDSPAERRRYINGRAGQYNKRFMTWFQQGMQETGLGSFNVAGRNFNRLAVGNLTASPGVKATSTTEALRLRLSIAAGIATAVVAMPFLVNKQTTGEYQPQGTEIGDVVLGKNANGTYKILNMRKLAMLDRGARASGVGAVMRGQVMPRLRGEQPESLGQTMRGAATDAGRTLLAPFSGPPVNLASVALTGKTELGFGYEQRTPGEKPPYLAAMVGQLNPLAGPIATGQGEGSVLGRVGSRLAQIPGVGDSRTSLSTIRSVATRYKVRNNIHTDDSSFAPSEYTPLKNALSRGDIETAKSEYQQLMAQKSQRGDLSDEEAAKDARMSIQKEFSKMENFRFVNKESEESFRASLTPQQKKMYDDAVAQQKKVADLFFTQIAAKDGATKNRYRIRAPRHFGGSY